MTQDWITRAASYSGNRSDIPADISRKKSYTLSFLKKNLKKKDDLHRRLSTDSTLIGDFDADVNYQLNDSDNPFSTLGDYRKAAQQSEDPMFRFQFVQYLINIAYKTRSDFFIDEARQWLEILANPSLIQPNTQIEGKQVLEKGFDLAQYSLANWLMSGSYNIKIDENKAFELYNLAASQDHAPSCYLLAKCYQDGIGTEKNLEKSKEAYEKASLLGDTRASYILGYAYIYGGIGIESNPQLFLNGIELLKACADNPQGDFYTDALYELSILHSGSKKTKSLLTDPPYSLSCLTRAANLGHDKSQFRLGYNYEFGLLGLPIDASKSISWYSQAADLGNADACLALSGWYLTGADELLPKSFEDAYLWARKACDKGSSRGHFAVGYYLEHGIGVKQDKKESKKWYKRAASMGDKKAIARLDELKSRRTSVLSKFFSTDKMS